MPAIKDWPFRLYSIFKNHNLFHLSKIDVKATKMATTSIV